MSFLLKNKVLLIGMKNLSFKYYLMAGLLFFTACSPDDISDTDETIPPPSVNVPEDNDDGDDSPVRKIVITINDTSFTATLEDNETVRAFLDLLPLTVDMTELNGNEKYCYLSQSLPVDSRQIDVIQTGDLMLYGSNCIVLFYQTFSTSYSYTRLGRIEQTTGLKDILGQGSVTVSFHVANQQIQINYATNKKYRIWRRTPLVCFS